MLDHIIIGVPPSGGVEDAVAYAGALGASRVTLVHAYPGDRGLWRGYLRHWNALLSTDAQARIEEAAGSVAASGLEVDAHAVADPSPARALQQAAADGRADLILLGSASHGVLGRVVVGDVARGVLRDAPCSVLITPLGQAR